MQQTGLAECKPLLLHMDFSTVYANDKNRIIKNKSSVRQYIALYDMPQ
jgi:hypothetical protein